MNDLRNISIYVIPGLPKQPDEIAYQVIKNVFGISHDQMSVKTRKRTICFPRQVHMTLQQKSGISSSKAGGEFGKDHATALHAKEVITNILSVKSKTKSDEYRKVVKAVNEFRTYYPDIDLSEMPGPWHDIDFNELRS